MTDPSASPDGPPGVVREATRTAVLRTRVTVLWAVLVLATLVSWGAGHDHTSLGALGVVLALLIAFLKVRYIGMDFMELRAAPPLLRVVFEAWCLVVAAVVIVLYLLGTP